jgi:hypothetical protein
MRMGHVLVKPPVSPSSVCVLYFLTVLFSHFMIYMIVAFLEMCVCKSKMHKSNIIFSQKIKEMVGIKGNTASILTGTSVSFLSVLLNQISYQH